MITIVELKTFAQKSNLAAQVEKLKPMHWQYAETLLAGMREETEAEMNRVWCSMPRSAKPSHDDKLARVIPELIVRVIGQRKGDEK